MTIDGSWKSNRIKCTFSQEFLIFTERTLMVDCLKKTNLAKCFQGNHTNKHKKNSKKKPTYGFKKSKNGTDKLYVEKLY